eukprot:3292488-Rhodomonas_salina.1
MPGADTGDVATRGYALRRVCAHVLPARRRTVPRSSEPFDMRCPGLTQAMRRPGCPSQRTSRVMPPFPSSLFPSPFPSSVYCSLSRSLALFSSTTLLPPTHSPSPDPCMHLSLTVFGPAGTGRLQCGSTGAFPPHVASLTSRAVPRTHAIAYVLFIGEVSSAVSRAFTEI